MPTEPLTGATLLHCEPHPMTSTGKCCHIMYMKGEYDFHLNSLLLDKSKPIVLFNPSETSRCISAFKV